jgi:glycosyltransferase involved in cell wall biosynthesis
MAFDLHQEHPMNQHSQRHLFVIGFARSGTSLLYSFLNLHPKIKLLYEADLLSQSLVSVSMFSGQNWWERLDFFNSTCHRHRLAPQPSWKNIRSAKEAATALYRQYGGSERRYIGEKSPTYYNRLPALARQFPEARFIIIWRNPHNMISSIIAAKKKHYFFSNRSFPLRAIIGFEQMQADVLTLRARSVPVFDLCYESLVEDPETWLKSICDFLEIPFDPRMLELDHADCSMFPPGEHHAKAKSGHLSHFDRTGEVLADPIQQKIPRYLSRWKALFRDQLVTRRYWQQAEERKPGSFEVLLDRVNYHLARFYSEQFTPFIYGFFPLGSLRYYRAWRGKTFAPSSSSNVGVPREAADRPSKISVVTPSYKQLPWLKLCVASIADQEGVIVEHIIQDAQSGPELEEWIRTRSKSQLYVECDTGMYDAINRGFARASGDIVCWLNSDEQYLEGSLAKVARFFETHPEIDVLFGDALLVDNKGDILSYRRTIAPRLRHIQASHLNVLSCATFVRRSVLDRGYNLDTRWKAIADAVWIADLIQADIPMAVMHEPLSVFTITDTNLGQTSLAFSESKLWQEETSSRNFWLRAYFVSWHRLMKLLGGAYWPRSVSTDIYTLSSPEKRVTRVARHIGFRWPHSE